MTEDGHNINTQILHLLEQTAQYFSDQHLQRHVYLVGGSVRNILLGEECLDWDIVTTGDAHKIARQVANTLGGHYVHMHEKASRVVAFVEDISTPTNKKEICFDISPLNGKDIEDDLRKRDFTINAMAAPLGEVVRYLKMAHGGRPSLSPTPSQGRPSLSTPPQGQPSPSTPPSQGRPSTPPPPSQGRPSTPPPPSQGRPSTPPPPPTGRPQGSPLHYHEGTNSYIAMGSGAFDAILIDPLHGLADLKGRRLKAVDDKVFQHDPLRMLRAVRLMMRYHLQIDHWTAGLIVRDAELLPRVAAERVHDELYAILGPDGATGRLHFLYEHGLFTVIFPEFTKAKDMRQPSPHHWDVLTHSIETVGALERVSRLVQGLVQGDGERESWESWESMDTKEGDLAEIRVLLREAEQQGIFSFAGLIAPRMKMATLLHDIGKTVTYSIDEDGAIHFYNHPQAGVPLVEQVMRRLCASTQDRRLAQLVSAHHMRPGQLGQDGPVTPRAIRRYFVDLGPTGIYVALISLADHLATLGPQPLTGSWERHLGVVRLLLTRYIRERESILPPRLISPEELMRRLKLEPGQVVGQLLDLISEAQAEGKIHSKEEAVWFAEETVHNMA